MVPPAASTPRGVLFIARPVPSACGTAPGRAHALVLHHRGTNLFLSLLLLMLKCPKCDQREPPDRFPPFIFLTCFSSMAKCSRLLLPCPASTLESAFPLGVTELGILVPRYLVFTSCLKLLSYSPL